MLRTFPPCAQYTVAPDTRITLEFLLVATGVRNQMGATEATEDWLTCPVLRCFPGFNTRFFYNAHCGYSEGILADALERTSRQMLDIMSSIGTLAAQKGVEFVGAHRTAHGPLFPCGEPLSDFRLSLIVTQRSRI